MELALLKFINGPSFGEVTTEGEGVFDVLSTHKVDCVMVDRPNCVDAFPLVARASSRQTATQR